MQQDRIRDSRQVDHACKVYMSLLLLVSIGSEQSKCTDVDLGSCTCRVNGLTHVFNARASLMQLDISIPERFSAKDVHLALRLPGIHFNPWYFRGYGVKKCCITAAVAFGELRAWMPSALRICQMHDLLD